MPYKHDYDKILTRLTIILSRLNDGDELSVSELAEEFAVSVRTIQRDMNERLDSFPIYQENKKWKMKKGYRLEKATSIEDTIILDIIDKFTEGIGASFYARAKKLISKIKNDSYSPIYTKLDIEDISDNLQEIKNLELAIKEKKIVECSYEFDTYSKKLNLKPLKIVNYEGFWYLVALDGRNDILKKYYLKNISSIKAQGETFVTTTKLDELLDQSISIWFDEDSEPFKVKLFVSNVVAKYLKRKPLSKSQITEALYDDGSMEISLKIVHEMDILPIVKYWLPHIKILEPKELNDRLLEEMRDYLGGQI